MTVYGPSLCKHTEFDVDCDCQCPNRGGDPNAECDWPDCDCGCKPLCEGCDSVLARMPLNGTHPGTSVPVDPDDPQNVGSKPEALGYHVSDPPEEWKKVDFR